MYMDPMRRLVFVYQRNLLEIGSHSTSHKKTWQKKKGSAWSLKLSKDIGPKSSCIFSGTCEEQLASLFGSCGKCARHMKHFVTIGHRLFVERKKRMAMWKKKLQSNIAYSKTKTTYQLVGGLILLKYTQIVSCPQVGAKIKTSETTA